MKTHCMSFCLNHDPTAFGGVLLSHLPVHSLKANVLCIKSSNGSFINDERLSTESVPYELTASRMSWYRRMYLLCCNFAFFFSFLVRNSASILSGKTAI